MAPTDYQGEPADTPLGCMGGYEGHLQAADRDPALRTARAYKALRNRLERIRESLLILGLHHAALHCECAEKAIPKMGPTNETVKREMEEE
jgi:hypothetical protein